MTTTTIAQAQKHTATLKRQMESARAEWETLHEESLTIRREYMNATSEGDARAMQRLTARREELEVDVPAKRIAYLRARIAYLEAQRTEAKAHDSDVKPKVAQMRAEIKAKERELNMFLRETAGRSSRANMPMLNQQIASAKDELDALIHDHAERKTSPVMRWRTRI
jgi:chromosome segregation ATPase